MAIDHKAREAIMQALIAILQTRGVLISLLSKFEYTPESKAILDEIREIGTYIDKATKALNEAQDEQH